MKFGVPARQRSGHAKAILLLVVASLALSACGGGGDSEKSPAPSLPAANVAELRGVLDAVPRDGIAPGAAIAVDHPGYADWSGAAGLASVETRAGMTAAHRLRAGSMLKTAVAIAVLQQVERSQLSLSATLDRVLPPDVAARVPDARSITVRMLLNHSSGIPDFADDDFNGLVMAEPTRVWTVAEYLARANAQQRSFAPGAGWAYSNTNYVLLGEVLRFATGRPWRQVVAERVFQRAGLHHSELPPPGDSRCTGCARGQENVDGRWLDLTEIDSSMADASGGHAWITTPADLAQLLRQLFAGKLFDNPATLVEMQSYLAAPAPEEFRTGYGLGLMRLEHAGHVYVGHFGGTAGFLSFMFIEPSTRIAISGYLNTTGDLAALLEPLMNAVARIPGR